MGFLLRSLPRKPASPSAFPDSLPLRVRDSGLSTSSYNVNPSSDNLIVFPLALTMNTSTSVPASCNDLSSSSSSSPIPNDNSEEPKPLVKRRRVQRRPERHLEGLRAFPTDLIREIIDHLPTRDL